MSDWIVHKPCETLLLVTMFGCGRIHTHTHIHTHTLTLTHTHTQAWQELMQQTLNCLQQDQITATLQNH